MVSGYAVCAATCLAGVFWTFRQVRRLFNFFRRVLLSSKKTADKKPNEDDDNVENTDDENDEDDVVEDQNGQETLNGNTRTRNGGLEDGQLRISPVGSLEHCLVRRVARPD